MKGLTPVDGTSLYDTALAAFRDVQRSYRPGEPNVVVLLTDGRNDDPDSLSRAALLRRLRSEQDPDRPVHLLTIAYGQHADVGVLRAMSRVTGGHAYASPNPAEIGRVFFQALSSP